MKKVLSVLLVLAVLTCCAACTGQSNTSAPAETPEASPAETVSAGKAELPPYSASYNECGFDTGAYISPAVIYDNDGLAVVTASEIVYDEYSAVLKLEIKNNTEDLLQYRAEDCSVNHLMMPFFDFDILGAGETVTKEMEFSYGEMLRSGVSVLSEITVCNLSLTLENGEEAEIGSVTLYTNAYGIAEEDGSAFDSMLSEKNSQQFSYSVLASSQERTDISDGVYAAATFLAVNEYEETELVAELHNDTDETVSISVRRPVVNGILLPEDCRYSVDLIPHSYILFGNGPSGFGLSSCCFETVGISPVCEISLEFSAEPENGSPTDAVIISLAVPDSENTMPEGNLVYEKDGLSVRSFGVVPENEEEEDYVGFVSVPFLVENNTGKTLSIQDDGLGALLLNGRELEFSSLYLTLPDGTTGAFSYDTYSCLTDELDITSLSEVTEGQMTLQMNDTEVFWESEELVIPIFGS